VLALGCELHRAMNALSYAGSPTRISVWCSPSSYSTMANATCQVPVSTRETP
jgi:hypothetical protein